MNETLTVWVGPSIIYLYGTVNGVAATFTLLGGGYWQAVVPVSGDSNYNLYLEAYSALGLAGSYSYTIYYGMMPLITDRTAADVRDKTAKGFYNIADLNRVGVVTQYLADELVKYGYAIVVAPKVDWEAKDILYASEMVIYIANVAAIKAAFYGTQILPTTASNLTHIDANNIELLLQEVYIYLIRMIDGFRICGTFKSGQGVILP